MKRFGTITVIDLIPPSLALERVMITLHSPDMMIGPINGRWMIRFTRPKRGELTEASTVGVAVPELPGVVPVAVMEALASAWEDMADDAMHDAAAMLRDAIAHGGAG